MDRKVKKLNATVSILQHKACVIFFPLYWAEIKLGFMEVNFPGYS